MSTDENALNLTNFAGRVKVKRIAGPALHSYSSSVSISAPSVANIYSFVAKR
jgi:hypothetical protein